MPGTQASVNNVRDGRRNIPLVGTTAYTDIYARGDEGVREAYRWGLLLLASPALISAACLLAARGQFTG